MYEPPPWCSDEDRWRFQVGFLLRFIMAGQEDFTEVVRPSYWKEAAGPYRPRDSYWFQRLYGLFNGYQAFGDDWAPISDWGEQFLLALLSWPGSRLPDGFRWAHEGLGRAAEFVARRIEKLLALRGSESNLLMIPMRVPLPDGAPDRILRACVVQTTFPGLSDLEDRDLGLSLPGTRARHRQHLSAALAAVGQMLELRETHLSHGRRLDWLILPELAVHPEDVRKHLIPFARTHKTIILAGVTYEEWFSGEPYVNSAVWVVPVWSSAHGWNVWTRRQGKGHLAVGEKSLNVQPFRPCQWLMDYEWSGDPDEDALTLTASICYDATDLSLATDLRGKSDVFAIPALNTDIRTFDQLSLALHYHMFQMVLVANNGLHGGSNAYQPVRGDHDKQIFHLHGQPQASIAFLEIDDIGAFVRRRLASSSAVFKTPPAGHY